MNSAQPPRQFVESLSVEKLKEITYALPSLDSRGYSITGCPYPPHKPIVYIKFGDNWERGTGAEARTQKWAYETLQKIPAGNRKGIFIPEIYRTVDLETWTIIVMEYVPGKTLLDLIRSPTRSRERIDSCLDKIEHALKLFLSLPVPKNASPGPFGGGLIRHPLFKDFQAKTEYPTVEVLERHINKIATWFDDMAPKVKLERDLRFVFSDVYEGNFIFTDTGHLYVIDFERAGFLPLSFMTYAMIQNHLVCSIKNRLDLPEENIEVMQYVCSFFMKSISEIGLPI